MLSKHRRAELNQAKKFVLTMLLVLALISIAAYTAAGFIATAQPSYIIVTGICGSIALFIVSQTRTIVRPG